MAGARPRRGWLLALAAALTLAGAARADGKADPPGRCVACEVCADERDRWRPAGLEPPCEVVAGVPRSERAERLAKAYRLEPALAQCVAEALEPSSRGDGGVEAGWRRCLARWPTALVALVGYQGPLDAALLGPLAREPEVAERLLASSPPSGALELARLVLAARPGRLLDVLALPALEGRDRLRLAAPLLEAAPTRTPPFTPAELAALARAVLSGALHEGYLRSAARVWMGLPPEPRATLRARPLPSPVEWGYRVEPRPGGGWRLRHQRSSLGYRPDLRETLAVALAAAGHLEEARQVPVPSPGRLLRCLLEGHPVEPLELAMDRAHLGSLATTSLEERAAALPCVAPEEALLAWTARQGVAPALDPTLPGVLHAEQLEALRPLAEAVARLSPEVERLPGGAAWEPPRVRSVQASTDGGHLLVWESDGTGSETARWDRQADGGWAVTVLDAFIR